MNNINQFQYDTILIAGWRKDWSYWHVEKECESRGIDIKDIDRRAFDNNFRGNIPVKAAIAQTCDEMSKNLWSCKKDSDFIIVRNLLNRGKYKFSGKILMISKKERQSYAALKNKNKAALITMAYEIEGSKKVGGSSRSKRWGGSN